MAPTPAALHSLEGSQYDGPGIIVVPGPIYT